MTDQMTRAEKRAFIRALTKSVRDNVLAKVKDMPPTWNGLELREYIADQFHDSRHMSQSYRRSDFRTRLRDYRNDVLTRPL